MRDGLIELCREAQTKYLEEEPHVGDFGAYLADYLLKYGVIAPPCKVGVEVYFAAKERDRIFKGELISFSLDAAHFWFFCRYYCGLSLWHQVEDFGKTVFLTREEAEQALKGGESDVRN